MKVSVVVPLYNKENSILRAVNSVLAQSEQDFELIVVNDGSTDGSVSVAAGISDKRIRIIHQENSGVSAARNRGVTEARSDLVAFLDADDEWLPGYLETILKLHSQFPDASVFGTLYVFQDQGGELQTPKTAPLFENGYFGIMDNYLEVLRVGLPFNSSSFAVTKKAFCKINGFPLGISYGEDVDTWIRLSLQYKIVYTNTALAIYHRDAENRASDTYEPIIAEYYPVKNLVHLLKNRKVPLYLKQSAIEYVAKYQLEFANFQLYNGRPVQARLLIQTCSGTKKYFKKWIFLYISTLIPTAILQRLIKIKHVIVRRFDEF